MKSWLISLFLAGVALATPHLQPEGSWARLVCADVVYLGEAHDRLEDHQMQLRLLERLLEQRKVVVLAEMFQTPSRAVLKAYTEGQLEDDELRELAQWDKRWGHPWELYLPIWQLCQRHELALLPLRNSTESGKQLSRLGRAAFEAEENWALAPEPYEFGPSPETLQEVFTAHAGPTSPEAFQRFLKVQVLWEEFMSAQIRQALRLYPGSQVVVLVGKGHLLHGHALAKRTQRAWNRPLSQEVVICDPQAGERDRLRVWWESASQPAPQSGE
jgi:uncharacterized iron-regulated protein